jgi:hypothetical protein
VGLLGHGPAHGAPTRSDTAISLFRHPLHRPVRGRPAGDPRLAVDGGRAGAMPPATRGRAAWQPAGVPGGG